MKSFSRMLMIGLMLLMIGCSTYQNPQFDPTFNENLAPDARLSLQEGNDKVEVALGLVNNSNQSVPVIEEFEGNWVLLNGSDEVRASGEILTAGPLEPNEAVYPLVWSAKLEPGTYTLKWAALSIGTVVVEFEVFDDSGNLGIGIIQKEISDAFLISPENKTTE